MKKILDDLYKEIIENMPFCCVDIVIHDAGKVLLVYRKDEPAKNQWWVPGGRIYKNEKLIDAVKRKVKEETGLDVEIEKRIGVYEFTSDKSLYPDVKSGTHAIAIVYLVRPIKKDQKIEIDSTSENFKWIDKIEENLAPYIKKILKDSEVIN